MTPFRTDYEKEHGKTEIPVPENVVLIFLCPTCGDTVYACSVCEKKITQEDKLSCQRTKIPEHAVIMDLERVDVPSYSFPDHYHRCEECYEKEVKK